MEDASFYQSGRTQPPRRDTMNPGPNHSRRAWTTDDGSHITVDTRSFLGPGFTFETFTGSVRTPQVGPFFASPTEQASQPNRPFSLVDSAFALLERVQAMQRKTPSTKPGPRPNPTYIIESEDESQDDDEEDEEEDDEDNKYMFRSDRTQERPPSNFQRLRDTVNAGSKHHGRAAESYEYTQQGTSEQEPMDRSRRDGSIDESRRRERYYSDESSESVSPDDRWSHRTKRAKQGPSTAESFARQERRAYQEILVQRKQLELQRHRERLQLAVQQPMVNFSHVHKLLADLQTCEREWEDAKHTLRLMTTNPPFDPRHQDMPTSDRRSESSDSSGYTKYATRGTPYYTSRRFQSFHTPAFAHMNQHPLFMMFENTKPAHGFSEPFSNFLDDFFKSQSRFPDVGGAPCCPAHARSQERPHSKPNPFGPHFQAGSGGYNTYTATPQFPLQQPRPPVNPLRIEEARQLFSKYTARWNALSPSDPNVPCPGRNLSASSLLARDSIWAPSVKSPVSKWSDENVMQANIQSFFLGAVGLTPTYTEVGGKMQMGFDKSRAGQDQITGLVDILKKEKSRWHSDRLGRRNAGEPGVNEVLQRDEKSRAVFHAVCELVTFTQST